MKNLKYTLVAALLACTMMSLAAPNGFHGQIEKKYIDITYESAIKIPGLVVAMYQQLDPVFLAKEQPIYVVYVKYKLTVFRISGTREQWIRFFKLKWKYPVTQNEPMGID